MAEGYDRLACILAEEPVDEAGFVAQDEIVSLVDRGKLAISKNSLEDLHFEAQRRFEENPSDLTSRTLVVLNCENYTAWKFRLMAESFNLSKELDLCDLTLTTRNKCERPWRVRREFIDKSDRGFGLSPFAWARELKVIDFHVSRYPRYHEAWSHRTWLAGKMDVVGLDSEIEYVKKSHLPKHVSNSSALTYLSRIIDLKLDRSADLTNSIEKTLSLIKLEFRWLENFYADLESLDCLDDNHDYTEAKNVYKKFLIEALLSRVFEKSLAKYPDEATPPQERFQAQFDTQSRGNPLTAQRVSSLASSSTPTARRRRPVENRQSRLDRAVLAMRLRAPRTKPTDDRFLRSPQPEVVLQGILDVMHSGGSKHLEKFVCVAVSESLGESERIESLGELAAACSVRKLRAKREMGLIAS